jgi:hypothetical protein
MARGEVSLPGMGSLLSLLGSQRTITSSIEVVTPPNDSGGTSCERTPEGAVASAHVVIQMASSDSRNYIKTITGRNM